jgi:hypothetical protein
MPQTVSILPQFTPGGAAGWAAIRPAGLGAVKETLRCWAARRGEGFFRSGETNHGNIDGSIEVLPASAGG